MWLVGLTLTCCMTRGAMRASDAFAAVANLLTRIVVKPYRDEHLTDIEIDRFSDAVLLEAAKWKEENRERDLRV